MTSADLTRFLAWLRRYPFCVTCAVLAIVMAGTSWFFWQQVQSLKEDLTAKQSAGENMLATLVSGTTLRADLAYAQEFTRRIETNLVVGELLSDNKGYFYGIEGRAHLNDVEQLPIAPPDTASLYKRIPFSLRLTGSYDQLASFLHAVETGPRLANITAFSFRRSSPPNLLLTLDLNVDLLGKR